jgi:hypothetical protein
MVRSQLPWAKSGFVENRNVTIADEQYRSGEHRLA